MTMKRKEMMHKIMAFLALFWIIIWIVWTGILILTSWWNNWWETQELTPEQYQELQKLIQSQSWSISSTWITINTWSWDTWTTEQ